MIKLVYYFCVSCWHETWSYITAKTARVARQANQTEGKRTTNIDDMAEYP
jgi:hypothetical protein